MVSFTGQKYQRRLYEPLALLAALGQVQGERIESIHLSLSDTNVDITLERRRILEELCKMCDFRKGGDTVTAMALEATPPTYWVATSEPGSRLTKPFLERILRAIAGNLRDLPDGGNSEAFEKFLFEDFTIFHWPRLRKTWKILQNALREEQARISLSSNLAHNRGKSHSTGCAHF